MMNQLTWLELQAARAREIERDYVSGAVTMRSSGRWSAQAQRMLEQVRENRRWFEAQVKEGELANG